MSLRTSTLGLLLVAACIAGARAPGREVLRKTFLGKAPPEIVSQKEHWLGKPPPTTFAQLKGQVVWLQFNF